MPSRNSGFDLQQRENSHELHEKLTNILERFEETHQAIKENVRMLENVSDSTTAIGSSKVTGSDTIDSSLSYRDSFGKHSRSASSNRLSGMDTTASTNYGLRTISSVDSGVMLTLTSCSEADTQSRSRSFGSWAGGTSPGFLTPGVEEGDVIQLREATEQQERDEQGRSIQVDRSPSASGSSEEEVFTVTQYSDRNDSNSKLRDRTDGSQINPNSLLSPMNRIHLECQNYGYEDSSSEDYELDDERFEVQESSIVFDEGEENSYQILSLPISQTYASGIANHTDECKGPKCTVYSAKTDFGESRRCIVLPPVHKERSSRDVVSFLPPKEGRWVKKDYATKAELDKKLEVGQNEGDAEHRRYLERSASTDSRLMFSPIPEESLSDWVPSSPSRSRKSAHHQTPPGPKSTQMQTVVEVHHTPTSAHRSPQASAFQENSQIIREHEEDLKQKLKKYRHRRKKTPTAPQTKADNSHRSLSSSTSSTSSALEISDIVSLSSYRNAIDRQPVIMPQVLKLRPRSPVFDSTSSMASLSYEENAFSNSSSSCSDSEYDYQVSLQNHQHHSRRSFKPFTDSPNIGRGKKTHAPVLRKMSKDKTKIKSSADLDTQKARKFKKNSTSSKTNHHKSLKMKSDEASHSLLRYFRFPSPPRTTGEDNSDSSQSKLNGNSRSVAASSTDRRNEPDLPLHKGSLLPGHASAIDERRKPSSLCSCTNTSTTDTVSEIAYPDLQSKRLASSTPQARLENVSQTRQTVTEPASLQLQDGLEPEFHQEASTNSRAINARMQHAQPQVAMATSYALPAQRSKKKESCCGFLNRLFRRKKYKKQDNYSREYTADPRLTLDLAGGEVRVKPYEPAEARVGDSPYIVVPRTESVEQLQKYDKHLYKHPPAAQRYYNYDRAEVVHPTERYQTPSPIFVVPREQPQYVPVVKDYQQHYKHRNMLYPYEYITSGSNQGEDNSNYYQYASQRIRPNHQYTGLYSKRNYQSQPKEFVEGYRTRDEMLRPFGNPNFVMMKPDVRSYQDHRLKLLSQPQHPVLVKRRKHFQIL